MGLSLETARLRLRDWALEDIDGFAEYCADPEMTRFIGGVSTREEAWREMAEFAGHVTLRGFGFWALEEKASGRFVGYCGLWFPEGWPEIEVGWGLNRAYHGRGYATEAAFAARHHAYDRLKLTTLVSYVAPDNTASIRVAERLGARFETTIVLQEQQANVYRHPSPTFQNSSTTET